MSSRFWIYIQYLFEWMPYILGNKTKIICNIIGLLFITSSMVILIMQGLHSSKYVRKVKKKCLMAYEEKLSWLINETITYIEQRLQ